jgi:uncharacterized protein (TIGR00255 family)
MTGYGKATTQLNSKKVTVEIRSLNSKQVDLMLRMPQLYREKESEIRTLLSEKLVRGKIDFAVNTELTGEEDAPKINKVLALAYIRQIEELKKVAGIDGDSLSAALRMPDVLRADREELPEDEWLAVRACVDNAIQAFTDFRKQEGKSIEVDFLGRIESIRAMLIEIEPFEEERLQTVKDRMMKNLEGIAVDQNRFEQELIFYIEKLDVNEEKSRLTNHLNYFIEVMNSEENSGRKLGFITQEIGREINTLGSKANHAEIQKRVVQMKEELERIKEQVLNAL